MKKLGLLSFICLVMISCNMNSNQKSKVENKDIVKSAPVKDGIFIHITEGYNNPHSVLMPLKMAVLMAEDKDVLVYMDIHATELLIKGAKDLEFPEFESLHTYLKKLIDKKVGIYACPTCLKVAGYKSVDLMEGIQLAQKDKFFNFTKGRLLTLDY